MTRTHRALVVDDDHAIRTLVKLVLERAGFEVEVAGDGFEAIGRLADSDFDVVILDLMMPRLGGGGVIDHLAGFDPDVLGRIVVISAAHNPRVDDRVFAVLPKPFDVGSLAAVVARVIDPDNGVLRDGCESEPAEVWH